MQLINLPIDLLTNLPIKKQSTYLPITRSANQDKNKNKIKNN